MKRRKILFYTEAYRENNGGAVFLLTGKSAKRHCCSLPNEKYAKKKCRGIIIKRISGIRK